MTHDQDFSKLDTLLDESIFRLSTGLNSDDTASLLKRLILGARRIHVREQIIDEIFEDLAIVDNDLRQVEISKSSHEDLIFATLWVISLETTSLSEYRLDSSETPIVVSLLRKE